ncbi:MAG: phenylalanine--tRNA ligase subunit alpha [Candidatus Firestonebacteria bacterium]
MPNKLENLLKDIQNDIENIISIDELEKIRIKYIGRNGILTQYFSELKDLPLEERSKRGAVLNTLKKDLENNINIKLNKLKNKQEEKSIDVTLPGYKFLNGTCHPLTQIMNEIKEIFRNLNFDLAEGPEIETEYYNFEALNTPKYHPARDSQSTFYLSKNNLLRSQTSAVQIRYMEKEKPPIRVVSIGKCYRSDPLDPSHSPVFHQVEGLMVDENITFGDLKGILKIFFGRIFGKKVQIRLNPSYFPFTEPSAEVSVSCVMCGGKGCSVCKSTGWLEIFGAGMVHPNVFKSVHYDSEKWTGFAFGGGIERLAMIKYNINDIRLFYENDIRFLEQF